MWVMYSVIWDRRTDELETPAREFEGACPTAP